MTKYQEFLNNIEIIPEDLFNEVINSLPNVEISDATFDYYEYYNSQDYIAECIINYKLIEWNGCYAEDVDFENKTFSLGDVQSLKDLEEIKKTFSKWTITDYDNLVEQFKKEENEDKEFKSLINTIRFNATIEQLRKFVNSL